MIQPINIIGILPSEALKSLRESTYHTHLSIGDLGAITIETNELESLDAPTTFERQAASQCGALVIFFRRYSLGAVIKTHHQLEQNVLLLAKGYHNQLQRTTLYVGDVTNASTMTVRWIGLPLKMKDWFSTDFDAKFLARLADS